MAAHDLAALMGGRMSWWFAGLIGVSLTVAVVTLALLVSR